jgi:DNA-directed RNA polymerase specialized sigma54-like protein
MAPKVDLVITPQLHHALKILRLSLPELEALVENELNPHPVLEPFNPGVARTTHSVNIDLETLYTPGGEPDCGEHKDAGSHYDITVHPAGCPHQGRPRANHERRNWRDFATVAEAEDFAKNKAAKPDASVSHPVRVRFCQVAKA